MAEEPIKGGYEDPADTNVVGILNIKVGYLCSGSLIAPNVILTAQHCVAPVLAANEMLGVQCAKDRFDKTYPPEQLLVTTKQAFPMVLEEYHKVRQVITADGPSVCGSDQAIMILEELINPAEAVPLVPRVNEELVANEEYFAVGYGAIEDDEEGTGAGERRRRDDLFVTCVAGACPSGPTVPEVAVTEWQGQEGICGGDSGGPAIDLKNRVIGVTSRGGQACTQPVYGYVFGQGQFIKDSTLFAAGLAGYVAPAWATERANEPRIGQSCSSAAECSSGPCVNDGVAQYCSRECSDQAPCQEGFTCVEASHLCLQLHTQGTKDNPTTINSSGCSVARDGEADPARSGSWVTAGALLALAMIRRRKGGAPSALKRG